MESGNASQQGHIGLHNEPDESNSQPKRISLRSALNLQSRGDALPYVSCPSRVVLNFVYGIHLCVY
jgi:hypothetical protein